MAVRPQRKATHTHKKRKARGNRKPVRPWVVVAVRLEVAWAVGKEAAPQACPLQHTAGPEGVCGCGQHYQPWGNQQGRATQTVVCIFVCLHR